MIARALPWIIVAEIACTLGAWAYGQIPWGCALLLFAVLYGCWVAATEAAIATEPRSGIQYGVVRIWPTRRVLVWARHGVTVEWRIARG